MSAIITNKLRIFNAQQFIESINEQSPLWKESNSYNEGDVVLHNSNLYVAVGPDGGAVSGTVPPTHLSGIVTDGGVSWAFYNRSLFNNLYMGIGKHSSWDDDSNPPTPEDSVGYHNTTKSNLLALKKVSADTISLAVPRIDWTADTQYTMYDHDSVEEIIPNGYILTEGNNQFNVYKCINNTDWKDAAVGVQPVKSTVKPTGTPTNSIIETGDGYAWKYMYSVDLDASLKFLTKDYVPVKFLTAEPNAETADYVQWQIKQNAIANSGGIDWVKITDDNVNSGHAGGSGYYQNVTQSNSTVAEGTLSFAITLSGTATALATNDYTGYAVVFTKTGATTPVQRRISNWNFNTSTNVATITIESAFLAGEGGSGSIVIAPDVEINGDGTGFTAYGITQGDQIKKIMITNKGTGYTNATATVAAGNVASDNVSACKVKPIISPSTGHGFNAVEELGGYYAMVALKLEYDEQDTRSEDGLTNITESVFPVTGDRSVFRQIVILSDPVDEYTDKLAYGTSYRGPQHPNYGTAGQTIFDIDTGTGKVLYVENRQPVSRAVDQIEDIKVVFEF